MEQWLVQILVLVANIHPRSMNAEVEQSSMSTSVEHGLVGPKPQPKGVSALARCQPKPSVGTASKPTPGGDARATDRDGRAASRPLPARGKSAHPRARTQ